MNVEIDDQKQMQLLAKFDALADPGVVSAALFVGGQTIKRIMAEYPPVRRGPMIWSSDKEKANRQRRYIFWARSQGLIPYVRGTNPNSEDMKHRWIVTSIPGGVEVSNNTSYARLVHDESLQTQYHKITGWKTAQAVMRDERARIMADIKDAYHMAIAKILSR